tara:strand:- start:329 stop:733 length:405 start_codon:yes stop_codon:yes gene_type:complete
MKFNTTPLQHEDYDNILKGWWKDWGWEAPSRDFLPQDGQGGVMVWDGDTPVCAGFLYNTNSKVAWVDWIISNKEYKESRKEALSILIQTLTSVAKNLDNKFAYALIKHNGLIGVYEQQGYTIGDSYNKEMIKVL